MVTPYNLEEKYNQVRRTFCFYLDINDQKIATTITKRIEDLGLQQEVFLTESVTHVVRDGTAGYTQWRPSNESARSSRSRADAMLERVRAHSNEQPELPSSARSYVTLTVQKAVLLLDKIYDTFFSPSKNRITVKVFTGHFIKIEFLDRLYKPVYKEFDVWPDISLDRNINREANCKKKSTSSAKEDYKNTGNRKMTRKNRQKTKEHDDVKEPKAGYCEMCNTDYADATLHRRSPHHLAFVRDHTNYLTLDSLISSGANVATLLEKASPMNGDRRSLRKLCNGDVETTQPRLKRCNRSQTPDYTLNGAHSPKRHNGLDEERKHNTRCSKRNPDASLTEDHYYKVVGVSTKLRSSGGFASRRRESPTRTCNGGSKPLVVKFRKVRRSELSVLSDEAEQFMFPRRTSTSSSSSDDDEDNKALVRRSPPQPPINLERRRLARPLALKEESSEEDSWPEDKIPKKCAPRPVKRGRPPKPKPAIPVQTPTPTKEEPVEIAQPQEVNPLRDEPHEKCMKWEDGRLKYTPKVDELEFTFESIPQSEPWFETFKRQDEDRITIKNVPHYFQLYSRSPKLPYEVGQLPPLKSNCCPLSDMLKRDDKPGPSRPYGTRGNKRQRMRKRAVAALIALEAQPRKSPREHASTLAILGSAGLLHRRRNAEDTKSTASEDTVSETYSTMKLEPLYSEVQETSERLHQFLSEVFDDVADYEVPDDTMEGNAIMTTSTAPDVLSLVSECEGCDIIRTEIRQSAASRPIVKRGHKFKKKNRTGWPNKKKNIKKDESRGDSVDVEMRDESCRLSTEPTDAVNESTQDESISEADESSCGTIVLKSPKSEDSLNSQSDTSEDLKSLKTKSLDDKSSLRLDVKVLLRSDDKIQANKASIKEEKRRSQSDEKRTSVSDSEEKSERSARTVRKKKGSGNSIDSVRSWLQPVVRVARVDPNAARRLRSAGRSKTHRFR